MAKISNCRIWISKAFSILLNASSERFSCPFEDLSYKDNGFCRRSTTSRLSYPFFKAQLVAVPCGLHLFSLHSALKESSFFTPYAVRFPFPLNFATSLIYIAKQTYHLHISALLFLLNILYNQVFRLSRPVRVTPCPTARHRPPFYSMFESLLKTVQTGGNRHVADSYADISSRIRKTLRHAEGQQIEATTNAKTSAYRIHLDMLTFGLLSRRQGKPTCNIAHCHAGCYSAGTSSLAVCYC